MSFTPYTLAVSDFALSGIILTLVILGLVFFGDRLCDLFDPVENCDNFGEPIDDARFDEPTREETGIACELAKLPPGSQLVEIDTAGMLTPPGMVMVHEYRWTGKAVEFVRAVPLHELSFSVPALAEALAKDATDYSEWPELKQARDQFVATATRLNLIPSGTPIGRVVTEL